MPKELTPVQKVHSVTRRLAHVERYGTKTEAKALRSQLAKASKAATLYFQAQAAKGKFEKCDPQCMTASTDVAECVCVCDGANHGCLVSSAATA